MTWPEGVGGKGNEGVAAYVQRIKGSIGYVEYAYAKQNKHDATRQLQNKDGQFVQPDDATFKAAAANADWTSAPGFYLVLTDQPGKDSWPITGASFILMHVKQDKPQNAAGSAEVLRLGVQERPEARGRARLRADARRGDEGGRGRVESADQGRRPASRSGTDRRSAGVGLRTRRAAVRARRCAPRRTGGTL